MTRMLSRPSRAALPAALALCAALMPGTARKAIQLAAAVLLARCCSLCPGGALRAAAGKVINASRLRGNFLTAIIAAIIGGAVSVALCAGNMAYLKDIGVSTALAGGLINLAQLFCDRLWCSGDRSSPVMYDIITAALAAVGLMISQRDIWLAPVLATLPALAGLLLVAGLRRGISVRPGFQTLACAPGALTRGLAVQALITGGAIYMEPDAASAACALMALGLAECCETPFRRSPDESHAVTAVCALLCAVLTAVCAFTSIRAEAAAALALGGIGVLITGAHPGLRRAGICVLMPLCAGCALEYRSGYIGLYPASWALITSIALCAACLALACPDITAIRRVLRARHVQRRRSYRN